MSYRKGSTFHNNLTERQYVKKDVGNKSNMDGNKISKSNLKEVSQYNVKSKTGFLSLKIWIFAKFIKIDTSAKLSAEKLFLVSKV